MLCTATTPVFSTAADPAPATAKVDEDTSLCGYMVKMQDGAAATAEALGGNCVVYGYDTWSEWYPTVSGDIVAICHVLRSENTPRLTMQKKVKVNVTCDESYYFVRPENLDEEDVILFCRSLMYSRTNSVTVAYPLYLDTQTQSPYIQSSYENAGSVRQSLTSNFDDVGVELDDALWLLRYYTKNLLLQDGEKAKEYFNNLGKTCAFDFSFIKADLNGDHSIDADDARLAQCIYVRSLLFGEENAMMIETVL